MAMSQTALKEAIEPENSLDYSQIAKSTSFQQLLQEKRNFIVPWSLFFMIFYFALPVLTAYSSILNKPAFGSISWAWIFASAQFIMTWSLCIIYTKRAAKFDQKVDDIKESVLAKGRN